MSDSAEALPLDPTKLVVATLSDPGLVRTENQDTAVTLVNVSNERLLAVADGVGGQRGGETASKLCVETLGRVFRDPHGTPEQRLRRGLELANEEVYSAALGKPELKGMGTTAVVLLFSGGTRGVWLAWVGDSRCYRLRDGNLEALTRDHSLMAEWVEMGVIRPEEVEKHPRRNELTRAIGQAPDVSVEVVRVDAKPDDRFLLCSDGIHSPVGDRGLKTALAGQSPEDAARALVERANSNGGPDNATAIVVLVPPEAFHEGAAEQPPEVALELELPSPPARRLRPPRSSSPTPTQSPPRSCRPSRPRPPASRAGAGPGGLRRRDFELELTSTHSSAAIDAAIAELTAARGSELGSLDDSASSLPQMFETATPAASAPAPTPPSRRPTWPARRRSRTSWTTDPASHLAPFQPRPLGPRRP